jgi:hypothetical protein
LSEREREIEKERERERARDSLLFFSHEYADLRKNIKYLQNLAQYTNVVNQMNSFNSL